MVLPHGDDTPAMEALQVDNKKETAIMAQPKKVPCLSILCSRLMGGKKMLIVKTDTNSEFIIDLRNECD